MPELPDVAMYKDYIDKHARRKKITTVDVKPNKVVKGVTREGLIKALTGRQIASTRRRGKWLGLELDNGGWMFWHFGMTGAPKFYEDEAATPKYARLVLHFGDGGMLAYAALRQLGEIRLADEFDTFVSGRALGPDALDVSLAEFRRLIAGRSGNLKSVLMNQEVLAGVGNVYADEILFQLKLHPNKRADELSDEQVKDLDGTMKRVFQMALKKKAKVKDLPVGYLLRSREKDGKCPRCGVAFKQMKVGGRTTYYCPSCQKA